MRDWCTYLRTSQCCICMWSTPVIEITSSKRTISGQLLDAYGQISSCVEKKMSVQKLPLYQFYYVMFIPVLLGDVLNSTFTEKVWMLFLYPHRLRILEQETREFLLPSFFCTFCMFYVWIKLNLISHNVQTFLKSYLEHCTLPTLLQYLATCVYFLQHGSEPKKTSSVPDILSLPWQLSMQMCLSVRVHYNINYI